MSTTHPYADVTRELEAWHENKLNYLDTAWSNYSKTCQGSMIKDTSMTDDYKIYNSTTQEMNQVYFPSCHKAIEIAEAWAKSSGDNYLVLCIHANVRGPAMAKVETTYTDSCY